MTAPQLHEQITQMALGKFVFPIVMLPGLPEINGGDDPMLLCARLVTPAPDERILLFGCGHAALGVALAHTAHRGTVLLYDPNVIALRSARRTMEINQITNAKTQEVISMLPDLAGQLDRVVILGPQSRGLARRWLIEALELLRPGGLLTLAGANKGGIQSLISDAAGIFGSIRILGIGRGCRVAEATRPTTPPSPPAWAATPGIAPGTWHVFNAQLPTGSYELHSLPGIFSYDHLDAGTDLLLHRLPLPTGARVLDVGCGYGPIGIAAAAAGAASIDMLDVNLLAVAAARYNATRYGLCGEVLASDGLNAVIGRQYDLIVSNPPFHAG
ncbi:MAG: methyltransferase, partial [Oscillochloris sp.]|nr:methyltransferase [Oscillochloris sp.]